MGEPPQLDGVSHRWVRARGVDFHLAEAGAGEDVVLCLHGWPQHWYEWRQLMPALADRHRVLALDLRGFGWSDAPRDGYEKEDMATDVLAVLDELGLDRVKLVGHDWGGWIGYRLHRRGEFVRRILVGGSEIKDAWGPETLGAFADNLAEPARTRAAVQMYRVFNWRELWPIARGRYARARLEVPTLMLFGAEDFVLRPQMLAGYQRHADDMRVELVPGCGHFIAD